MSRAGEPPAPVRAFGRRAALRAGGLALAAVALRPAAPARAAVDEGALLLGLWRREMNAAFAYARHSEPSLVVVRSHEEDHAAALATQLAAVGHATPPSPQRDADLDVAAAKVATAGPKEALAAAVALEEDLEAVYRDALPALPDPKIAMTAATILASHAQHLFILRAAAEVT